MNKLGILSLLTGALNLGAATATDRSKLAVWIDDNANALTQAARDLIAPPFSPDELSKFAGVVVVAVQRLQDVFAGADRAKVAQIVFVEAARAALPDGVVEDIAVKFLSSEAAAQIIEAAYQKIFGAQADAQVRADAEAKLNELQPQVDDTTLPAGEVFDEQPEGATAPAAPAGTTTTSTTAPAPAVTAPEASTTAPAGTTAPEGSQP